MVTPEEIKGKNQTTLHEEIHQVRINDQQISPDTLKKGVFVYLQGKIQTKQFVDDKGVKRFKTEIIANALEVLSAVSPVENGRQSEDAKSRFNSVNAP